jgi:lipoprotein-anchoring transpeptidase ErfK/SrfK
VPTSGEQARLGPFPKRVSGGPANPLGARALYLFQGNTDTLYRIHGQSVSSGCIRMTNADAIDLFDRVKMGTTVVVLPFSQSISNGPSLFGNRRT